MILSQTILLPCQSKYNIKDETGQMAKGKEGKLSTL